MSTFAKYKKELLLEMRPGRDTDVQKSTIEKPDEIHVISFNSESDFAQFMANEERKNTCI